MIETGFVVGDEFPNGAGGLGGGNGAAEFVRVEIERAAFLPGATDFFIEAAISSGRNAAVEGSADDGVSGIGEDNLLSGNFGFGIDGQWIDSGGLVVIALKAIEHEVGGEEEERDVFGEFGEAGGDIDVEQLREAGVSLTGLAFAQGGAVNDQGRLV